MQDTAETGQTNPPLKESPLRETARDLLIYVPSRFLPALASILAIKVFSTLLPKAEYGAYLTMIYTAGFVTTVLFQWIKNSAFRYLEAYRQEGQLGALLATVAGSLVINFIVILIAVLIFRPLLPPPYHQLIIPTGVIAAFAGTIGVLEGLQRAARLPFHFTLMWVLESWGKLLVGWALIIMVAPKAMAVLAGNATVQTTIALAFTIWLVYALGARFSRFNPQVLKRLLRFGIPMVGSALAIWGLSVADRYVLLYYRGEAAVSNYSVGYLIPQRGLDFTLGLIMIAGYPIIVSLFERGYDQEARQLISQLCRAYIYLGGMVAGTIAAFPGLWIRVLSDYSKYGSYAFLIPIIGLALAIYRLAEFTVKGWEIREKTHFNMLVFGGTMMLNLALNLLLVPRYGELGAALASLVSLILATAVTLHSLSLWKWEFPWLNLLRTLLLTSLLVSIGIDIDQRLQGSFVQLVAVPVYLLLYMFLHWVTGDRTLLHLLRLLRRHPPNP